MSRTKFTARFVALAALVAFSALALPLHAYDLIRGPGGAKVTWNDGSIPLVIRMATAPTLQDGTNYATSVQAAAQAWNSHLANVQFTTQVVAPGKAGSADGINEVVFDTAIYSNEPGPMAFGANTIAVTVSYRSVNPRADGTYARTQADVLFNSAFIWDAYRGPLQNAVDIRRTAIHELGHVLGLGHPDAAGQTVSAVMNSTISAVDGLREDDIVGAQFLYSRAGGFTPPANDLWQNATPVNLTSGIVTVTGSSVGATKEAGEPNFLSTDAGGASVWWKWTSPVGGTLSVTTAGSHFDTLLGAFIGEGVGSLVLLAASDDSGALRTSALSFYTKPGETYYFAVDGKRGEWGHVALTFDFSVATSGTLPVITRDPQSTEAEEGGVAYFTGQASGSPFPSLRWERRLAGASTWHVLGDSEYFSGTNTGVIMVRDARADFDGSQFRCVATNSVGSATSAVATLTVVKAPPRIVTYPQPVQVLPGASVNLSVTASGTAPLSYQWFGPNSQPISGANSSTLQLTNVQASGYYYVSVSNAQGSVTAGAYVTVVVGPVIATQPRSWTVMAGAYVSLSTSVTQSANHTYQWYRNGVAIPGATNSYLDFSQISVAQSGDYTVVVTNAAGSTTSQVAEVVVYPLEPVDGHFGISVTNGMARQPGEELDMQCYVTIQWSAGVTFQWYRDGVLVPGATSSSYRVSQVAAGDYADYFATATNSAGVAVSNPVPISYQPRIWNNAARDWIDAHEHQGVVYFLFQDTPRVERYSLAQEAWLTTRSLPAVPRAFAFDGDQIYLALTSGIVRSDLSLSSFSELNSASDVTQLLVRGPHLLASASFSVRTYNKETGSTIATRSVSGFNGSPLYLPAAGRVYAQVLEYSPHSVKSFQWADDGSFPGGETSTPIGFGAARKLFALPSGDGFVAAHGAVYTIDGLRFIAGLGGAVDDLQWLPAGGAAVVRYGQLLVFDSAWREAGRARLDLAAQKLSVKGAAALCFAQPANAGGRPAVQKIALSAAQPPPRAAAVNPVGRQVWSPRVFGDGLGTIFIHSPLHQNVIRWSANQATYLPSVPLRGLPRYLAANVPQHALFYDTRGFTVRRISLEKSDESGPDQTYFTVGRQLEGAFSAREFLVAADGDFNTVQFQSVGPDSRVRGRSSQGYGSSNYAYTDETGELFFQRRYSSAPSLHQVRLRSDGEFSSRISAPNAAAFGMEAQKIHVSPDGTRVVLSSGLVVDAKSLVPVGNAGRDLIDVAWAHGRLHTLQRTSAGCRVIRWSDEFGIELSTAFPSQPLGLFAVPGNRLALVTRSNGLLTFRVLNPATHAEITPASLQSAPQLLTEPEDRTVSVGDIVHFAVAAQGASPRYQWQRNGMPLQDEPGLRGTSGPVLVVEAASNLWAGDYRVIVNNDLGTTISRPATLTVLPAPQSITFEAIPDRNFTRNPIPLVARASSGLPVVFELLTGSAEIEGNSLHLTGPGSVTVRARQPGTADYRMSTAEQSFMVFATLHSWAAFHFTASELEDPLIGGPLADPDGDGMTNLLEYALGSDPKSPAPAPLAIQLAADRWHFTYERPTDRADIAYVVEVSTDLQNWTTSGVTHESIASTADRAQWRATHPRTTGTIFFRLRVSAP